MASVNSLIAVVASTSNGAALDGWPARVVLGLLVAHLAIVAFSLMRRLFRPTSIEDGAARDVSGRIDGFARTESADDDVVPENPKSWERGVRR